GEGGTEEKHGRIAAQHPRNGFKRIDGMTSIAVVILNYNGEKLLPQYLPSVVRYSEEATLFVADNGSTDQSLEVLKTAFPQVTVIELGANYGFCGGYNKALQQIQA